MEFLTFFGGVWGSIILGVIFILMVLGCNVDRNNVEEPKWCVFWIGLILLIGIDYIFNLFATPIGVVKSLSAHTLLLYAGIYLGIGLAYSVLEFMLNVRRSSRLWAEKWNEYKYGLSTNQFMIKQTANIPTNQEVLQGFLNSGHYSSTDYKNRIVNVKASEDRTGIEPTVDRSELAQAIGCWTFFWPFYAVSLIIGDLFTEIFRIISNILASISGRFVKLMFKDLFKF